MAAASPSKPKNPRRVEAGRLNALKRKGLTPAGLERLRVAALANRPWGLSTGPRTPEGKRKSAANGRARQVGPQSVRELRAELAAFHAVVARLRSGRRELAADGIGSSPIAGETEETYGA